MKDCPSCDSHNTDVVDTRIYPRFRWLTLECRKRRRRCLECGHRWNTLEIPERDIDALREQALIEVRRIITEAHASLTETLNKLN